MTATISHVRLMGILKQIGTYVYPVKGVERSLRGRNIIHFVDQSRVREIEISLQQWFDCLPEPLKIPKPGPQASIKACQSSPSAVVETDLLELQLFVTDILLSCSIIPLSAVRELFFF